MTGDVRLNENEDVTMLINQHMEQSDSIDAAAG